MITNDEELFRYALTQYDTPHLRTTEEFESDVKRLSYLNSLLTRYRIDSNDLRDRLIVNHIIIIGNCFTIPGAIKMMEYKISPENILNLNSFLIWVNYIHAYSEHNQELLQLLYAQ